DADVASKRVLVRVDLNVPMQDGKVSDTTRIDRIIPTINNLRERGAKVILLAHFGRPKGEIQAEFSLEQIVPALAHAVKHHVAFAKDC
ncbi:phosphoglycerate kinase, partial [Ochrobactrum sp. SFR4]|uniref:phosphoglycerate kinase n=1 Tax=Ochrobactrum sp. SFR4 TaxID=2717368 RepID=UPI001C8C60A9